MSCQHFQTINQFYSQLISSFKPSFYVLIETFNVIYDSPRFDIPKILYPFSLTTHLYLFEPFIQYMCVYSIRCKEQIVQPQIVSQKGLSSFIKVYIFMEFFFLVGYILCDSLIENLKNCYTPSQFFTKLIFIFGVIWF